ncbi:Protein MNN4 [Coniochaeta hoffmannii]|uniref:Protein MNN4 n=1 Tax=Coniochaeta hoffmannii TaxID=91930 RepID=A0AA38S2Z8_9PEZI|nr:Protein MNN4 [Coniochaeta hoffmannii]
MQLCGLVLLLTALTKSVRGEIDLSGIRRRPEVTRSSTASGPSNKYFREATFHPHYDGRFADHALGYQDQQRALRNLMRAYLRTFSQLGVDTWLVHGSLLGWWWGKKVMPWDSDMDVMVTESSIYYLAAYYNMTTFWFKTGYKRGKDYLLEVNPNYSNREQTDVHNRIDARWIDTETGLFIDITAARYNLTHPQGEGMMTCKDGHEFRDTYVFPLRKTTFEGAPAMIPYRYKEFLVSEYGEDALNNTDYHGHFFDEGKMRWVPREPDGNSQDVLEPEMG